MKVDDVVNDPVVLELLRSTWNPERPENITQAAANGVSLDGVEAWCLDRAVCEAVEYFNQAKG